MADARARGRDPDAARGDLLGWTTGFSQTPSATFGCPDRFESYDPERPFGEQASRDSTATSAGSFTEDYTYEPGTSRIIGYERVQAGMERLFAYDGTGQLVHMQQLDGGVKTVDVGYAHGMDDELLVRSYATVSPYSLVKEYHFGTWQLDRRPAGDRIVEAATSAVRLVTDPATGAVEREWVFKEVDGHAIATMRDDGSRISTELMGSYGTTLESTGSVFDQDRFHGMETDSAAELTRMGVRHMMVGDGRWMQPEPLLALAAMDLKNPRHLLGSYAGGDPNNLADLTGYKPIIVDPRLGAAINLMGTLNNRATANQVGGSTVRTPTGAVAVRYLLRSEYRVKVTDQCVMVDAAGNKSNITAFTDPQTKTIYLSRNVVEGDVANLARKIYHELLHVRQFSTGGASGASVTGVVETNTQMTTSAWASANGIGEEKTADDAKRAIDGATGGLDKSTIRIVAEGNSEDLMTQSSDSENPFPDSEDGTNPGSSESESPPQEQPEQR